MAALDLKVNFEGDDESWCKYFLVGRVRRFVPIRGANETNAQTKTRVIRVGFYL